MNKNAYFDYSATTPLDSRVLKDMTPYLTTEFGNPGSMHSFGQRASAGVFASRQIIARALGVEYSEIIFTSSATEANNLALRNMPKNSKVIVSAIEHDSIIETAKTLELNGNKVVYLPVSKEGKINLSLLAKEVSDNTSLVSIIYANNEIGTIQDIARISKIIKTKNPRTIFHTDAVQAFQYLSVKPKNLGVDMLTLSAHKIYGPKGVGLLYAKNELIKKITPIITGGGQEQGLRSGTENVASIVGFASAVELIEKNRTKELKKVKTQRDFLWKRIQKIFPSAKLNGVIKDRLANNLNIFVPSLSSEEVLVALDLAGVAVSSGSACSARSIEPSHVLLALGYSASRAKNSFRITLGRATNKKEINQLLVTLKKLS